MSALKAIQTKYNGYYFRSRLEARWAVFFDTLGIKYYYEHEGYEIDGEAYLPDFQIPSFDIYHFGIKVDPKDINAHPYLNDCTWRESAEQFWIIEIKPILPTYTELLKVTRLSKLSGFPCFLLCGEPYEESYQMLFIRKTKATEGKNIIEGITVEKIHEEKYRQTLLFMLAQWARLSDEPNAAYNLSNVVNAYTEARQERFESNDRDQIYRQG